MTGPAIDVRTMRHVCELHGDGLSGGKIATALGTSRGAIMGRLHRLRLAFAKTGATINDIADVLADGMTVEQIEGDQTFASYALAEMRRGLGEQAR